MASAGGDVAEDDWNDSGLGALDAHDKCGFLNVDIVMEINYTLLRLINERSGDVTPTIATYFVKGKSRMSSSAIAAAILPSGEIARAATPSLILTAAPSAPVATS
jgi:hypothetical protein